MNYAVFGAGAVGAQIALRLSLSGCETTLVARGRQLHAIRQQGLTLRSGSETVVGQVRASSDTQALGVQDVVIVAVKGTALESAAPRIRPLIGERTRLVYAMNGIPWWFIQGDEALAAQVRTFLDPNGTISRLVPVDRLIWSMVLLGGAVTEPGVIENAAGGPGALTLGYPDGHIDREILSITNDLSASGIRTSVETNIRERTWFKLLMNAGQATVATLAERSAVDTVSDPELRAIIVACMQEILLVGRAIGIEVNADPEAMTQPARHGKHRSSLLQDLQAGKPLELRSTIQVVRQIARLKGIATPYINTVAALISARSADLALSPHLHREEVR